MSVQNTDAQTTTLADVNEIDRKIENDSDGENQTRRRPRRRKQGEPKPRRKPQAACDPLEAHQKRMPYFLDNKRFHVWLKENYPAIRSRTQLTPEIAAEFDRYDLATARQRRIEVAEFADNVFSYAGENDLPAEFRRWASATHRIHDKEQVTREIMLEWREFELAQQRAHHAKADFDTKELPPSDFEAGIDEWRRENHRYFELLPNTRSEWAALLGRRKQRLANEAAEANRKAAKERAETAERQRRAIRVEKLKKHKLPPVETSVPNVKAVGSAQEERNEGTLQLWRTWRVRFDNLPAAVQTAWRAYHQVDKDTFEFSGEEFNGAVYLTPRDGADVEPEVADEVVTGLRDPAFAEFRRFSEGVRRALQALDDKVERVLNPPPDAYVPHRGSTLDEIKDEDERYVLAGVIPEGLAVLFGAPKVGKSAWAQKLSACLSSSVPFDGAQVAPGRVLYVSCDTGARKGAIKRRMSEILSRLKLPSNRNMVIVEDPVILNDAASVASLLEQNPGKFTLVVIDPLYQCVTGSLLQDSVMMEAIKGLAAISRATDAAVLLIHHEPRGSRHLFGSMLLDAALDAQIHVAREKDAVTVKVELLKNGKPPQQPFVYQFEGAYLASTGEPTRASSISIEAPTAKHGRYAQILARLPEGPIREIEARKLVEDLLTGRTPEARRQQWHRALKQMATAGDVTRHEGMVKRSPR